MTYHAIVGDILFDKEAGVASIPRDGASAHNLHTRDVMVARDRAELVAAILGADGYIVPDASVYQIVYR